MRACEACSQHSSGQQLVEYDYVANHSVADDQHALPTSVAEFCALLEHLDIRLLEEKRRKLFARLDKSGDNSIGYTEFQVNITWARLACNGLSQ